MKKIKFITIIVLMALITVGCVSSKIKDAYTGMLEIANPKIGTLESFLGVSLAVIERLEILDEQVLPADKVFIMGKIPGEEYYGRQYADPRGVVFVVIYVMKDGKPFRAERIAIFTINQSGPEMIGTIDRYKNTDNWYPWDADEFIRQYPNDSEVKKFNVPKPKDPTRFKRHDAVLLGTTIHA